jgi:hypothetical protein
MMCWLERERGGRGAGAPEAGGPEAGGRRPGAASRLVLSHRTVQNHVQNTLGKLQLHNRVELVRYAIEHGLAGEPEP